MPSMTSLLIKKASQEEIEEQLACNKDKHKNARDGARERARKEVSAKDRLMIVEFMKEAMKRHNMITDEGRSLFWVEVINKYNISRERLKKM